MRQIQTLKRRGFLTLFFCLSAILPLSALSTLPAQASSASLTKTTNSTTTKTSKSSSQSSSKMKNKKNGGSFEFPDFAFPQTVEKNAQQKLDEALRLGDGLVALRAAIQLAVATGQVSSDAYAASIARFDIIAKQTRAPFNSLALLLEAQIYSDIYASQSYEIDERVLPPTPRPANVLEWSRRMFVDQVDTLISAALTELPQCADIPLSTISPIITDPDPALTAGFTVADFITVRAVNLLRNFNTDLSGAMALIADAIKRHETDASPLIRAYFANLELNLTPAYSVRRSAQSAEHRDLLSRCYHLYGNTDCGAPFLTQYCSEFLEDNPRRQYELLTDYIRRFPGAYRADLVQSQIDNLSRKQISVNFPEQILPNTPHKITVEGANIYDFYVLVYNIPATYIGNFNVDKLLARGKQLHAIPVHIDGATPDEFKTSVEIPPLTPGYYTFVYSTTPDAKGIDRKNKYVAFALVSDLTAIEIRDNSKEDGTNRLVVTSATNGKPIEGAEVTFVSRSYKPKEKSFLRTTAADGSVELPRGAYDYEVKYNGNTLKGEMYGGYYSKPNDHLCAQVLTDLSLYRPGDKVQFALVTYRRQDKRVIPAPGTEVSVILRDANWQAVDTLQLFSDGQSRAHGEFTLPSDGLLGDWSLQVVDGDDDNIGDAQITVAEYKAPTFRASVDKPESAETDAGKIPETLTFNGIAQTYAGMPVADATVEYSIKNVPCWWRRFSGGDIEARGETLTASDGSFKIDVDTAELQNDEGSTVGLFRLQVKITNGAGETVQTSQTFVLGKAYDIVSSLHGTEEITNGTLTGDVRLYDLASHPQQRTLYYELSRDGAVLAGGSFESPAFSLDVKKLPSARYSLRFALNPDFTDTEECRVLTDSVTIWRRTDKRPPVTTALWAPITKIVAPVGAKSVRVPVGASYADSWILASFCTDDAPGELRWLQVADGIVELPVDAPGEHSRAYVNLFGTRDLSTLHTAVEIVPERQEQQLQITAETFRDGIEPGAREEWKFRFTLADKSQSNLPAMAVMTNKALNAIVPFRWDFNPFNSISYSAAMSYDTNTIYNRNNSYWAPIPSNRLNSKWPEMPEWNTYDYPLYQGMRVHFYGSSDGARRLAMPMMKMAATNTEESYDMEVAMNSSTEEVAELAAPTEGVVAETEQSAETSALREVDCPLAFFMPDMTTDAEGIATVSFTAPAFVGTWQLQVLGYTGELRGSVLTLDAVSAKPVMAQLNAARFLRTGDRAAVSATLYNNSDTTVMLAGRIEIIDAVSGNTLLNREFDGAETAPSGSRVVTAEFAVPANVEALQVRAYALAGGHSDGEQTLVPVYPSSTPVLESVPFYLQQGEDSFSLQLPKYAKDAVVTLSYCGNPIWECVTALPGILMPESASALAQAYALFGNAVAASLFEKYPQIGQAIAEEMTAEELTSRLERDPELKIFAQNNTPWVLDAKSETLRMQSLSDYCDKAKRDEVVASALQKIGENQNADGGWSWCPGMKSSNFTTAYVLQTLAKLQELGILPAEGRQMAKRAFKYCDDEFVKEWNESKHKYVPTIALLNYLTDKSSFADVGHTAAFKSLQEAAMKKIRADWRDFSIEQKATAAILLDRRGYGKEARILLESLRQFASTSREKGMWFDNMSSRYCPDVTLMATTRVLEAYAMIEPQSPAVDLLRQWLVVTKQTQNWGESRCTAESIYALLTSGSNWITPTDFARISLDGKPLEINSANKVTGSVTIALDASKASKGKLTIERGGGQAAQSAGPAWGGVVSQQVLPILDVKSARIPELSIEKAVYQANGSRKAFEVGDRVRVTLTLTCDRDLEYVAIADARAACLEPAEQVSEYTQSDGVWFYREVRNNATNIFIPYLSKGTHVLSYECFIDRDGVYSLGIAAAQSQYAPTISAHSAGQQLTVRCR